jgi:hypothetical protein
VQLDEKLAVKFLLPAIAEHPDAVRRFLRGGRAAVKIKSEHVARVFDVGTLENGAPYHPRQDGDTFGRWRAPQQVSDHEVHPRLVVEAQQRRRRIVRFDNVVTGVKERFDDTDSSAGCSGLVVSCVIAQTLKHGAGACPTIRAIFRGELTEPARKQRQLLQTNGAIKLRVGNRATGYREAKVDRKDLGRTDGVSRLEPLGS